MALKEDITMKLEQQQRKKQEREALDAKLSGPFKKGDIISDVNGELIGVFKNVAYHGGTPEGKIFGNYIFAEFKRAISKQGGTDWRVIDAPCGDDDTYIDRRENTLTENYRFATDSEKQLFKTLMAKEENDIIREKEKRRLRMKKKRKARKNK